VIYFRYVSSRLSPTLTVRHFLLVRRVERTAALLRQIESPASSICALTPFTDDHSIQEQSAPRLMTAVTGPDAGRQHSPVDVEAVRWGNAALRRVCGEEPSACRVSLILPCFNGGDALQRSLEALDEWIADQPDDVEVILSDDGSDATDAARLVAFARGTSRVRVVGDGINRGKGAAVERGLRAATGRYRVFTDSDLAYPLSQVERIIAALEGGADVAIANRLDTRSRYLMSPRFIPYLFSRHVGSRIFNRIVRTLLVRRIEDTQAGLKGFNAAACSAIAPRLTVTGFAFDIEALVIARAHRMRIVEVPVEFRYDNEPSTVRYARDAVQMLWDVMRILWHRARGAYA
jgi:dolichyl-phosphate beta-glucosyltransferase